MKASVTIQRFHHASPSTPQRLTLQFTLRPEVFSDFLSALPTIVVWGAESPRIKVMGLVGDMLLALTQLEQRLSTSLLIFTGAATLLLSWRLWRFTIEPTLKPAEPKELPYWLPFFGHIKAFFQDAEALQKYGRSYFNNTREIFTLTVAGQRIYVVTAPEDISEVYKNHLTLTFDGYVRDMYAAFSMSPEGIAGMFEPAPSDGGNDTAMSSQKLNHLGLGIHREQLYAGKHLEDLSKVYLAGIEEQHSWTKIPKTAVLRSVSEEKSVFLRIWLEDVLGRATTQAFFGKRLLEIEPELLTHFHTFDTNSWKLLYQYPRIFAGEMFAAIDKGTKTFTKYFELPRDERRDCCHYIQAVETKQVKAGVSVRDIAIAGQNLFWAANANSSKITFWLLLHVISNPSLLDSLRKEIAPATSGHKINVHYLLENCPLLDAVFNETLRLATGATSARNVDSTTIIAGKKLLAGSKIIIPYRQLHYDEGAFGPAVRTFNPSRFIDRKELRNSPYFKPFGGGTTYCSGRFIARRQTLALVAVILTNYDVELEDKQKGIPPLNMTKPTLGVMDPAGDGDILIKIRPREAEADARHAKESD